MNFCRSLAAKPRALPLRSRLQKQLAAVLVLPLAGIHGAAAQPDDHRQMLNSNRALEFASAAGRALERGLLEMCRPRKRLRSRGPELIEIAAQTQNDFFRIEHLAGVVGRTMLRAAPAFDAGVCLQRVDPGHILAGIETEILVAR